KRSLVAAAGGALLLTRRVPTAVAMEMLLTGDPIDAERAAAIGLVNRLTGEGGALEEAVALATTIAANAPLAVAATKRIARSSADWTLDEGWAAQGQITAPVFSSEDAREGATAFAEKRAPVWKGR
ncbi:enoyl-CoA hydratase, partial [Pseudonocardia sp. KRD-188]